jgi:FkbM family methyltransferase
MDIIPPDSPPPPAPPPPPIADLSHRPADRQPNWEIIPEWLAGRISQTVACTDADHLPRVDGAGDTIIVGGESVQVMHNGVVVTEGGYYGPLSSEVIRCLRGVHEPQEEVAFDAVVRRIAATAPPGRAPIMIELGSYWAYYSLWFLDSLPHGRSICLEPDPRNLAVGQHNFELNERTGTFINAAIGDGSGAPMSFQPDDGSPPFDLPTYDLRALLDLVDIPAVDLLLADIQGGELPLLLHSIDLLRSGAVRFMVVSTHDLAITGSAMTHQHVLAMLVDAGAHIVCEHSVSESVSGDGLVVAAFHADDRDLVVDVSHGRARESLTGEWEPRVEAYRADLRAARARIAELTEERDAMAAQLESINGSVLVRIRNAVVAPFRRGRDVSGS